MKHFFSQKSNFSKLLLVMNLLFFAFACSPPTLLDKASLKPMPKKYQYKNDSAEIAKLNWREYFSDTVLIGLIDTALRQNLDLSIAFQRIETMRANMTFTKGLAMPYVQGGIGIGQQRFGKYTMDGVGNFDTNFSPNINKDQKMSEHLPDYDVGLVMSWEVDIWGRLKNMRKAALNRYLGSIEGRNFLVSQIVAEVADNYYDLLALDRELEIIEQTIILQKKALDIVLVQKQAGTANALVVQQFEAQFLASKSLEFEIRQEIVRFENRINTLLGRFPQTVFRNLFSFSKTIKTVAEGIPTQLLQNRPDIRQADYELQATQADVLAARTAFFPSLTLRANTNFHSFNPEKWLSLPSLAYHAVGGLSAPLLNQSELKSRFRGAKADEAEAFYYYQKTVINAYTEVHNLLAQLDNLEKIYELKSREVTILTEAIETSATLFATGRASYLEVIFTQEKALQSRLTQAIVRKRQYQTTVDLYRALGGGWR